MRRPSYLMAFALAVPALAAVVVIGALLSPRPPETEGQRRVRTMIEQIEREAASRTPEPCISFTTRGFVPCP